MGFFDRLGTLNAAQHQHRPVQPKHGTPLQKAAAPKRAVGPVTTARDRAVARAETRCREAVWKRDQHRSRATGTPVTKGHPDEKQRGEVAHLSARSTSPAKKWHPANCVLLTAEEHRLSDARNAGAVGRVLLVIKGKDARKTLTFTRIGEDGRILWRRQSAPPPAEKEARK